MTRTPSPRSTPWPFPQSCPGHDVVAAADHHEIALDHAQGLRSRTRVVNSARCERSGCRIGGWRASRLMNSRSVGRAVVDDHDIERRVSLAENMRHIGDERSGCNRPRRPKSADWRQLPAEPFCPHRSQAASITGGLSVQRGENGEPREDRGVQINAPQDRLGRRSASWPWEHPHQVSKPHD